MFVSGLMRIFYVNLCGFVSYCYDIPPSTFVFIFIFMNGIDFMFD